mgnify:CR=1 FL=1
MIDPDDGIPSYLGRLTQAPLLSAQQEEELTRRVQNGDAEARQRLIECNMRLVINIARSYRCKAVPLEDLIQEGAIGLMQAAERFDPSRGFRFSTYATHWIRQAIGRAIDSKSKAIRVPAHVNQALRRIERERTRLLHELGYEPSLDTLAAALGLTTRKLVSIMHSSQDLLSLDMSVGDSGGATLGGLIRDERVTSDPESKLLSDVVSDELRDALSELNDREQRVMRMRLSLDDGRSQPVLQEEVAREMKLSRERVRQIEIQAIKKLRHIAMQRKLREIFSN